MNLPPLDHSHPEVVRNPYSVYRAYRENFPIHFVPSPQPNIPDQYIFTRYKDVMELLRHKHLVRGIRASDWDEKARLIPPEHQAYARNLREMALFTDPPQHAPLRKAINRTVNKEPVRNLREWIAQQAKAHAATLPIHETVDVVRDYAELMTTKIAADLLGLDGVVPLPRLESALAGLLPVLSNRYNHAGMAQVSTELEFLEGVLSKALARPVKNLEAAHLLTGVMGDTGLQSQQVIPTAILLLFATRDNVRNMIGNTMLMLLSEPERWLQLREKPELLSNAINEVLRLEPAVQFLGRHAGEDIEFSGVTIKKGKGVTLALAAANRDPLYFKNPDDFDVEREQVPLATFGFGIHLCPGDKLGRIIIEEAIRALLELWKNPKLETSHEDLAWQKSMVFRGLETLKVKPR